MKTTSKTSSSSSSSSASSSSSSHKLHRTTTSHSATSTNGNGSGGRSGHHHSNNNNRGGVESSSSNGGLTFGPAWLRQLSTGGENSSTTTTSKSPNGSSSPTSILSFQLAKNRYGREEMLAIYQAIEKKLMNLPGPVNLIKEFDEISKRESQKPISFSPPSQEEQVFSKFSSHFYSHL